MKKIIAVLCVFGSLTSFAKTYNCKSESGKKLKFNEKHGEMTVLSKSGEILIDIDGLKYGSTEFFEVDPVIQSTEIINAEDGKVIGKIDTQDGDTSITIYSTATKNDTFKCK